MKYYSNNERVEMTRRHFNLPKKVALRDSKIANQLIKAWDIEHDAEKVFNLFVEKCDKLSTQRYWELLRTVWIVSGGLERVEKFRLLMSSKKKNRYCFTTPEDSKKLREMPDTFRVYRACNNENDGGISWTYMKAYGKYYKDAFNKKMVIEKQVKKEDVFALIDRNNEYEILIL